MGNNYHKLIVACIDQMMILANSETLDLNRNECKLLQVMITRLYQREDVRTKIAEYSKNDQPRFSRLSKALLQLYSVVKRAENLMQRCRECKGWTWQQRALTLFAMEDDVLDIYIHMRWWSAVLATLIDVAVGGPSSKPSTFERVKEANQAFEQSLKGNCGLSMQIKKAAEEDKQHLLSTVSTQLKAMEEEKLGKKKRRCPPEHLLLLQVKALLTGEDEDPTSELNEWKHDGMHCLLGQGSYGVVHKVRWCGYGCVLKQYNHNRADGSDDIEVKSMKRFHHPHIVRYFRHWREEKSTCIYKSHLLMERMEKDLEEHIKSKVAEQEKAGKSRPFSEPVAIHIMLQVINAIWHMHSKGIVHRDLKPKNILVRLGGKNVANELATEGYVEVKLGDFGIAKDDMETSHEGSMTKNTGTTLYRAPELSSPEYTKLGAKKFPHKLDIWSFGIVCSQILTGKQPFEGAILISELRAHIDKGVRPYIPDDCPDYLRFCIEKCWEKKPENRPKAVDVWRMLRVAQLRSLGLIDQNYDLFSFRDHCNNLVELAPRSEQQQADQVAGHRRTRSRRGSKGHDRSAAAAN